MLKAIHALDQNTAITLTIEGTQITVARGTSVAAASLASGLIHTRLTPVQGTPRAPYCLMGVCFDCLMVIDGIANQRACQIVVAEGMVVNRQDGKREIG